jgi:hypothetical protein
VSTTWAIYDRGTKTFMELGKKLKLGHQRSDAEIMEFIDRATGVISVWPDVVNQPQETEDGWVEVNATTWPGNDNCEEEEAT